MAKVNRPDSIQDYRTPKSLLQAVEKRFGKIDFDAACTTKDCVVEAIKCWDDSGNQTNFGFFFDEGCNALEQDWSLLQGKHVWCNPRFRDAGKFANKIYESTQGFWRNKDGSLEWVYTGPRVSLLVPASIDTKWFWDYVWGSALVLVLNPRVKFLNPDGSDVVDAKGKAVGINRPMILAEYGEPPDLERWRFEEVKKKKLTKKQEKLLASIPIG